MTRPVKVVPSSGTRWAPDGRGAAKPDLKMIMLRPAAEGWQEIKRRLAAEQHTLYVLDEFTYPINWGWVDINEVIDTLAGRGGYQHVIITGRRADPKLIEAAQLVTEMTKIKHPFDNGQKGQRGIEW
jgi:cob(I)alamin adenosyltransferase